MSQYDRLMSEPVPTTPSPVRAVDIPRSWTEALIIDPLVFFNRGARNVAGGLFGLPVDAINFVNQVNPARLTPESWGWHPRVLPQPQLVRDFQGYMRAENQREHDQFLSEKAKRQMQEFDQTSGFWDAAGYTISNPSFLGMAATEQVPQLVMAVPGRIQATIALQSGLAGSMNASETRNELAPRVAAGEITQQEADRRATTVFTGTSLLNAGTSMLPGAQTLERLAAGQAAHIPAGRTAAHIATSIAGEAAQGGLTEAGEQLLQNLATDKPWNQDVGKVAALGAMLEGPLGGAGRGVEVMVSHSNQPPIPPTLAIQTGPPKIDPILQSEGFRRWYGERSIEQLEADYAKLEGTDSGRLIDTDLVRELSPDYAADRSRAGEVHEYASALTKELFARALARPPSPDRAPVVAFLAGGGGSGKSTAGKPVIDAINPDIIVDGTLANQNRAQKEIEASLASGRDVNVVYVYRSPEKSVEGAIDRAIAKGRPVPVDALAEAHANAATTVKTLDKEYGNNSQVRITAYWNDGNISDIRKIPTQEIPHVDQKQAEQIFRAAVESANSAGKLPPKLYAAFNGRHGVQSQNRHYPDSRNAIGALGENISSQNEDTRSQQHARHPVTFDGDTSKVEETSNVNQQQAEHTFRTAVESANTARRLPTSLYKGFLPTKSLDTQSHQKNERNRSEQPSRHPVTNAKNSPAADNEHSGTTSKLEPQPVQDSPHTANPPADDATANNTHGLTQANIQHLPQTQRRQIMGEAFKQDPVQAAEAFPVLTKASNVYQGIAKRLARVEPQRRDATLELLKNTMGRHIERGIRMPSPRQVFEWTIAKLNGRGPGHGLGD